MTLTSLRFVVQKKTTYTKMNLLSGGIAKRNRRVLNYLAALVCDVWAVRFCRRAAAAALASIVGRTNSLGVYPLRKRRDQ
jgi:hypothetical protein